MRNCGLIVICMWLSLFAYPASQIYLSPNTIIAESVQRAIQDLHHSYGDSIPYLDTLNLRFQVLIEKTPPWQELIQKINQNDVEAIDLAQNWLQLQRDTLLAHPALDFEYILLVKRSQHQLGLPQNWQGNSSLPREGYDNEIVRLQINKSGFFIPEMLQTIYRPTADVFVGDLCLHWDADSLLFSSLDSSKQWHVYELKLDGNSTPLRITPTEHKDVDYYDACYLPDERILFCSTAGYVAVPCVYGSDHVAHLFQLHRKTGVIRQLCFDQDHNWCPRVLPNGRVLYLRWEYSDTPHSNTRILFHMNPDGTDQREYWGSGTYFPNSFFFARPLPDTSNKVVGIASGHHGTARSGRLLIVSPGFTRSEGEGIVQEIPGWGKPVIPIIRDRLVDGVWPQFLHPYPITEKLFLVSAKMNEEDSWGIWLVDIFDNKVPLAKLPNYALFEPIPLKKQTRPPIIPDRIKENSPEGTVLLQNVYEGDGLIDIPKGEVKALRVYQYYFSHRGQGGLHGTLGNDSGWDIKRVLGTVPVSSDGSAYFTVPANTAIAVQPLDSQGQALQIMRSWFTLQPGENTSCIGCHESQRSAPPSIHSKAFRELPNQIYEGWHSPERGFSFMREVQPVLDRYCAGCHGKEPPKNMVIPYGHEFPYLAGDKMIEDWNTQISGGVNKDMGGVFSESYASLQRFVRRPGIESDLHMLSPMDFHFSTTELGQLLRKGHYNVTLDSESLDRLIVWHDLNAPYHGTWGETHPRQQIHAPAMAQRAQELRRIFAPAGPHSNMEYIPKLPTLNHAFQKPEPVLKPLLQAPFPQGWPFFPDFAVARLQETQTQLGQSSPYKELDLGNGVLLKLTLVPGGVFLMGSQEGHPDESPPTTVQVRPFLIGQTEITNEQFRCFMPDHRSRDESRHGYQFGRRGFEMDAPQQPVVRVSWDQAMRFCEWLSVRTGLRISLPTEAQWEWAARAGSNKEFFFGPVDSDYSKYANLADRKLKEFAQCTARDNYEKAEPIINPSRHDDRIPRCDRFDDGGMVSMPVGSYLPNAWDLYDMHGNVWEWTLSEYKPYPYDDNDGRNTIENYSTERVVRGGSWRDRPFRATASYRLPYRPYQKVFNVGFRIVVALD